jgi:hypothetical protein
LQASAGGTPEKRYGSAERWRHLTERSPADFRSGQMPAQAASQALHTTLFIGLIVFRSFQAPPMTRPHEHDLAAVSIQEDQCHAAYN